MDDQKFEQLVSAWLDGRISEFESQQLQELLRESANARKGFVKLTRLDAALRRLAEGEVLSAPRYSPVLLARPTSQHTRGEIWNFGSNTWGYIALSVGLICLSVWAAYEMGKSRITETNVASKNLGSEIELDAGIEKTISGYATLGRTAGVRWPEGDRVHREGNVLPSGLFQFEEGVAEIDFFCGATLVVEGPARLVLESDWSARLVAGRVRAKVPPAAEGFVLKVAGSEVVDLGTEFALDVGAGYAHVKVIDGEVKLRGGAYDGNHLTAGQHCSLLGEENEGGQVSFEGLSTIGDVGRLRQDEQAKLFRQWKETSEILRSDDRVIAYYPIADSFSGRSISNRSKTGADRDASFVGPVSTGDSRFGEQLSAVGFDRPGSRLRTRIDGEFSKFTFACWARIDSLDNLYNALFMADGYENGEPHWQIRRDGRIMFSVMVDDRPGTGPGVSPSRRLHRIYFTDPILDDSNLGQWIHLAVTFDPNNRQVVHYVNGEEVSRHDIKPQFFIQRLRIGASEIGNWGQPLRNTPGFAVRNLNGLIDEMIIFDAALDEEEIFSLYENGKPLGY